MLRMIGNACKNSLYVIRLVFTADPQIAMVKGVVILLLSVVPVAVLYVLQELVDIVSADIRTGIHYSWISGGVIWLVVVQGILLLAPGILRQMDQTTTRVMTTKVTSEIRRRILKKMQNISLTHFEDPTFYDLVTQSTSGVETRPAQITFLLAQLVQSSISAIGLTLLLSSVSLIIPLILTVFMIPFLYLERIFGKRQVANWVMNSPLYRQSMYLFGLLTSRKSLTELRLYQAEPEFSGQWDDVTQELTRQNNLVQFKHLLRSTWLYVFVLVGIASVLYIVWMQIVHRKISIGAIAMLFAAISQFQMYLSNLILVGSSWVRELTYVGMFREFLKHDRTEHQLQNVVCPSHLSHAVVTQPIEGEGQEGLIVRNLGFQYPTSDRPAVQHVSFTLSSNSKIALVGRNGSGKTTLAKLLLGLYEPSAGSVCLHGVCARANKKQYYEQCASVLQEFNSFELSFRENMTLKFNGKSTCSDQEIDQALKVSGLKSVVNGLPDRLDSMLGTQFSGAVNLSGGQWQRVAIARALLRNPRLLILDEALSAVDPEEEAAIYRAFMSAFSNRIVIFITHRLAVCPQVDEVFLMENGQIMDRGYHSDLLQRNRTYYELFNSQAQWYQRN